jgi:hypothetical protein
VHFALAAAETWIESLLAEEPGCALRAAWTRLAGALLAPLEQPATNSVMTSDSDPLDTTAGLDAQCGTSVQFG